MKKIFVNSSFLLVLGVSMASGAYLNGIAAVVNNEPITDYDVELVIKQLNVKPNDALNMLIRAKLEDAQIKELGISAPESEINAAMGEIAKQNGYSDFASYMQVMSQKGVDLNEVREGVKKNITKEKLYESIMAQPNENITRQNAQRFYEKNQGMFTRFSAAKVTKYTATSGAILERVRVQGLASGVSTSNLTIYPQNADPRVLNLIASTNEGDFTPIVAESNGYAMYRVNKKENPEVVKFEEVEQNVAGMMMEQEREAVLADYFNKLRAKASIEIIKR